MATRKTEIKRFMRKLPRPSTKLTLLLQDVEDPVNVGSAFRIADAARVEALILTGISAQPDHRLVQKVGRGKHRRVPWRYEPDAAAALQGLKDDGWHLCAVELTPEAEPYYAVRYPERTCLVVGHEDHGVTKAALGLCHRAIFIPMYGKGASLNVHVALGVTAFHVLHHDRGPQSPG